MEIPLKSDQLFSFCYTTFIDAYPDNCSEAKVVRLK